MLHAREDYNRIQDPEGKIGADEPVFLLRAQDISAPSTLRYWAELNISNGGDLALSEKARAQARAMEQWQEQNTPKPADL